ncbi:hypothetical protein SLEP1_g3807 [Rubroshorea leprosula]|uniref:Uncharacterized protein n=1 Tax=Rubroshorea leprosula TaxID=152421 RepID=A0AAV5HSR4_9ROSI|nr:hypothetical protein SLEP1_g3807 [Rubroshorea leprosula]
MDKVAKSDSLSSTFRYGERRSNSEACDDCNESAIGNFMCSGVLVKVDESVAVMTWKLTRMTPKKMRGVLSAAPISCVESYMLQAIPLCWAMMSCSELSSKAFERINLPAKPMELGSNGRIPRIQDDYTNPKNIMDGGCMLLWRGSKDDKYM